MLVFKVKWLPWIMIIVGVLAIIVGVANFWSVASLIAGIIWAAAQVSAKKGSSSSGASTRSAASGAAQGSGTTQARPYSASPQPPAPPVAPAAQIAYQVCPYCGSQGDSRAAFCNQCGAPLNRR